MVWRGPSLRWIGATNGIIFRLVACGMIFLNRYPDVTEMAVAGLPRLTRATVACLGYSTDLQAWLESNTHRRCSQTRGARRPRICVDRESLSEHMRDTGHRRVRAIAWGGIRRVVPPEFGCQPCPQGGSRHGGASRLQASSKGRLYSNRGPLLGFHCRCHTGTKPFSPAADRRIIGGFGR
jgi:hypothetical protein